MTGSLQIRTTTKKQEYYYVVLSYRDPVTEQWKIKSIATGLLVKNNKRKAEALIPAFIEKYSYLESPVLPVADVDRNVKLCDYIDTWLAGKKVEIKNVTWEGYAARVRGIKKYFEHKNPRVRDVTPRDLDRYYKWCLQYGRTNQKTKKPESLSVRSTRSNQSILHAVFRQAVIDGIIKDNPADHVNVHGKKNRDYAEEMLFLTRAELSDLMHYLDKEAPRFAPIAFIAAYYGLRRSELLGLRWDAIDFEKHQIEIKHTVVRVTTVEDSDVTKTPAGRRTLMLFPTAESCLQQLKAEQEKNRKLFGNTYQNHEGFVFTWEDGRRYDPNYISRTFAKCTAKFGRPEITLHKLRHTCVSLLSELGWDLKKIQYWCGHADFSTTANIYMHFNRQRLNNSADDLSLISADCADLFGEKITSESKKRDTIKTEKSVF